MADGPRSRLDTEQRREQLLELGLRLFARRAYDEVSIDEIARQASVSKGLLYHYFGSKRDFYVEVVRHASAGLLEALQSVDEGLEPKQRARAGLSRYLAFVQEHADAYVALMTGGLGSDPAVQGILEESRRVVVQRIWSDIAPALGLQRPPAIFAMALRSWIGAVEAAALEWLEHHDVEREDLLRLLVDTLQCHVATAAELHTRSR